jgi:SpoIIAA-like
MSISRRWVAEQFRFNRRAARYFARDSVLRAGGTLRAQACRRRHMPIAFGHERDNVFRLDLRGALQKGDWDACQRALVAEIGRRGTVRLLVVLAGFAGWVPDSGWNDLTFYAAHGNAIDRIAIVGPERWRDEVLMFAAADLRRAPVEFFAVDAEAQARAWLSS